LVQRFIGTVQLSDGRRLAADAVVLATGAAKRINGAPAAAVMTPVHGQMIAFGADAARAAGLQGVLRGFSIYACVKPGGRLIAGATSEPGRDDSGTDPQARAQLLHAARAALPALRGVEPVEHWSGLRPASADGYPLVEEAEPGLFLALGGYRNGVLAAPAVAVRIADALLAPDRAAGPIACG